MGDREIQYANWPRLIKLASGELECPICQRQWDQWGRGQGFVKAGASKHLTACFDKQLAARGLQMGYWVEEKQAFALVPLTSG